SFISRRLGRISFSGNPIVCRLGGGFVGLGYFFGQFFCRGFIGGRLGEKFLGSGHIGGGLHRQFFGSRFVGGSFPGCRQNRPMIDNGLGGCVGRPLRSRYRLRLRETMDRSGSSAFATVDDDAFTAGATI
ncbi:MAG TPA: hypothetical protein VIJ52_00370, partial [Pseudolabrys sp.]